MERSVIIMCTLIGLLAIGGSYASKKNEQDHATMVARSKTAPERIVTQGLRPVDEFQSVTTASKWNSATTYWVMAETDDWILLNGPHGTNTCYTVLREFGDINAPQEGTSLANLRMLAVGFKDKPLNLDVIVPRFQTEPAGLSACVGFSYDLSTGTLKVGDKKIAYLAPTQPGLVNK